MQEMEYRDFDIAIVGMAGRFPKANSIEEFWNNLISGKDCITRGIEEHEKEEEYVNAYGRIDNREYFDANFFGMSEVEAEMHDPQQRLILKLTQEALDDAGIPVEKDNSIGLYAGADEFIYVWQNILGSDEFHEFDYYTRRFCLGGSLTSRVSYTMNLKGPSLTMKAACATSTVTTHMACQGLLNYECDVALAGAVEMYMGQSGYYVAEGTISKDGVTRPFDEKADGFVPGNGGGLVVLKRLSDSLRDHDRIYAIIRGSAMNNDGNQKLGYSAPSVLGEVDAIRAAQEVAEVEPEEVSFIETHGTATQLGDVIEIDALKQVYRSVPKGKKCCALGAVKSNVGHLNTVAGIAGIIKTALMLYHKKMVPTIHFEKANPKLGLEESPFYVNTEYCDWKSEGKPLIAGVSSFGIGGTNCHIVLQEPPVPKKQEEAEEESLLILSAKTSTALEKEAENLADYLEKKEHISLKEAAYTLQAGRESMSNRRYESVLSREDAIQKLRRKKKASVVRKEAVPTAIFMFPGTSFASLSQIQEMCKKNKVFRQTFETCMDILSKYIGLDAREELKNLENLQSNYAFIMSVTFSIDYAMAKMWMDLGIKPAKVMGYSLGEYVAACISGVISLEDAMHIVYKRGALFNGIEDGYMMTIMADRETLEELLIDGVEISACNAEKRFMVSGLTERMEEFKKIIVKKKIPYADVALGKPGHCYATEPLLPELRSLFQGITFHKMQIPMISTCTGKVVTLEELQEVEHWVNHTRHAVHFYDAIKYCENEKNVVWIECGFGQQLYKLTRKNIKAGSEQQAVMSVPGNEPVYLEFLSALGQVWQYGIKVDWDKIYEDKPYKVSLPSYPFEEKYYYRIKKRAFSKKNTEKKEDSCVLYDGLSDARFELAKYLASKNDFLTILMKQQELSRKNYSLTRTVQDELVEVEKIQESVLSKSEIQCMWEYDGLVEAYDALCQSCASDYFKAYHVLEMEGEVTTLEELYQKTGVVEEYKPLFRCMLQTLEDGHIEWTGEKVVVKRSIQDILERNNCFEKQTEKFPAFQAHMNFLLMCADKYTEILSGKIIGKEVLYPNGSYQLVMESSENVPTTTRTYEYCNILAQSICHMMQYRTRKVRILEFGAGTGLITWQLAETLKDCDIEYYFTDVGRSFITQAQKIAEEKGYHFMKFAKFDISRPLAEQGIPVGTFDFVISCNVIQALDDMENALRNVSQALTKGGMLCLLQTVRGHRTSEMTFGLCPEWWNYVNDPKRVTTPVLSYEAWTKFLEGESFSNIKILPSDKTSDIALLISQFNGEEVSMNQGGVFEERIEKLKAINPKVNVIMVNDYKSDETENIVAKLRMQEKADEIILCQDIDSMAEEQIECEIRNETDQQIVDILYEVVGLVPESLDQQIFELDVDSLSGLIISTKIRTQFQVPFTIKELLRAGTIRALSDQIQELQKEKTEEKESIQVTTTESKKTISDLLDEL